MSHSASARWHWVRPCCCSHKGHGVIAAAPRCFDIERRLIEALDCPVMHDDQHGTAIVVLAALIGAATILDRDMTALRIAISGAGAAGIACANLLQAKGISDITVLDSRGILHRGRGDMNVVKAELAGRTNLLATVPVAWSRRCRAPTSFSGFPEGWFRRS